MVGSLAYLGAGLINSAGTLYANQQTLNNTNRWNDVQVDLANTAHQREVLDLRAAGLNPVLSASSNGAAVPTLTGSDFSNPGEGLSQGIANAVSFKEAQARIDNLKATNSNLKNQGELFKAQADAIRAGRKLIEGDPDQGDPELPEIDLGTITSGARSLGEKVGASFVDTSAADFENRDFFSPLTGKNATSYDRLIQQMNEAYKTDKWERFERYLKNNPDSPTSHVIRDFIYFNEHD